MSPAAAGGAAPTLPTPSDAVAPAAIAAQDSDRRAAQPTSSQQQENPRDSSALQEGPDPGNAAPPRKTAWNVPPPPPTTALSALSGSIIAGEDSWPALAESMRTWPKSSSSDSLSISDGSALSAPEDLIVLPVSNPISSAPNVISTNFPRQNSSANQPKNLVGNGANFSCQNDSANRPNLVGNGGGSGRKLNGSRSNDNNVGRNSIDIRNREGDSNQNEAIGGDRSCNSSHGGNKNNSGDATGSGEGSSRNGGGGGYIWSNNARNGNSSNHSFGSRGGRNRRDHERGGSFSSRNYPRFSPGPHHQQQMGIYQPGSFYTPPSPPPGHFMAPPAFMPYVSPFVYPNDTQAYPYYITVDQQFQNMHLGQQPMHPLWFQQDQPGLQEDIRQQIEFYFSTNNLCHDTYLREHMNEQGWVPIDLLVEFPMLRRFLTFGVDNNYMLDAIRGSEKLEVQGNNVRRRNDWANWLIHH